MPAGENLKICPCRKDVFWVIMQMPDYYTALLHIITHFYNPLPYPLRNHLMDAPLSIFLQVCQQEIYGEENFNLGILTFSDSFKDQNPMELLSETGGVPLNSLTLDYTASSTLKKSKINDWALSLEIRMERKVLQSFVQIIAPPGLLVVVSWVSNQVSSHNFLTVCFLDKWP